MENNKEGASAGTASTSSLLPSDWVDLVNSFESIESDDVEVFHPVQEPCSSCSGNRTSEKEEQRKIKKVLEELKSYKDFVENIILNTTCESDYVTSLLYFFKHPNPSYLKIPLYKLEEFRDILVANGAGANSTAAPAKSKGKKKGRRSSKK